MRFPDAARRTLRRRRKTALYIARKSPAPIDKKQLEIIEGNIIDDKAVKDACGYECYDIVCANILADVLEPLSTCIHEHMKHGAYFITSGIIDTKENEVAEAFKKNPELEIVEINHDGEWVNITARRK